MASAGWLASVGVSHALTYHISYLEDEGKRAQITAVMNEAVAVYNATTNFNVDINVIYHSGIPTAQSDYNGQLGFGGSISTQVALHEIAHYLGSGTTSQWDSQWGAYWNGAALRRYVKLFDGPGGEIYRSGVHYYPYGFNYGNEDSADARRRLPRLIQAMRFDMGGQDIDGDGMSDEWERYKAGNLNLSRTGDVDGDGISNYDEWWTDGDPLKAVTVKDGHTYVIRARHSQKVVNVAGNSADNGANVDQFTANGSTSQQWTASNRGGGYWRFTNVGSGKVLETTGVSTAPLANIQQWEWLNNDGQQWRLVPSGGGLYFKIFNKAAMNQTMDVLNGSTADSANILQYNDVIGAVNQEYAFDDVTPGESAGGLRAEYKFENSVRDNSSNNFHGIGSGGISYTAGRVDSLAATFNGTSGSVEIATPIEKNFSIACWVKTTATGGTGQWYNGMGLVDADVGGVTADFGLALVGTKIGFGVGNPETTLLSGSSVNDGNWHHVVATRDNATGALKIYIDGVLNASGTGATGARSAPNSIHIGSVGGTVGFYNGSLDEVRIYNMVLGQAEISKLANVGSTLVGNYQFENNIQDISGQVNNGNPVGAAFVPGKDSTSAVQFDGVGTYAQIPASVVADFSISYWVKTTATGGTGQWYAGKSMVDADVPGVANDWGIALVGNKAAFGMGDGGAGLTIQSTTPINNGAWQHVVVTRVNSSGAMKIYINGILEASGTGSTALRDAPHGIRLGSTLYGGSYFAGTIDDLRIYNYALSGAQISGLFAPVPEPWVDYEIGSPVSEGSSGYSASGGGVFTVSGGGTGGGIDLNTGTTDQFHLLGTPVSGDQVAITRVTGLPSNSSGTPTLYAKAGLAFRTSTNANSAFVQLLYDHGRGLRFRYRDTAGATTGQVGNNLPIAGQFWLQLVRSGNTFTAFYSTLATTPTAADWISLGSHNTTLGTSPLAGLAVCANHATELRTATFSNFSITQPSPGDSWRQQYFLSTANTGDAADGADPDHDGITNLMERALGLNPNIGNSGNVLPQLQSTPNFITLSYIRSLAATDLECQVIWSSDLTNWSSTNVIDTVTGTTATTETHEAKVPVSTLDPAHAFLRLRVR
ncbi:MAG: LamG-like jellyroll fold domain-containing protein [Luteolibacter sp.]|uniref:LamG-like jellyroll fold domain-containing protein n=1 Tax=Luteolibacter sp. TaxID=1962973 RepID=UPI00326474FA